MNNTLLSTFDLIRLEGTNNGKLPNIKYVPVSPSEKGVRKDIDRLNQNIAEIKKLKEELEKNEDEKPSE